MHRAPLSFAPSAFFFVLAACTLALSASPAAAQSCQTSDEMENATHAAITSASQRYFDMAARGDSAALQQNAIPSLAADFSAIQNTIKDHQPDLSGAQATVKSAFLLDADTSTPGTRQEFYCGVFAKNGQTANSAAFYLNNLPPGKYAIVLLNATSTKGKTMFSEVLQQSGTDWKLGGLYVKAAQIAGHDSDWFLDHARQYKAKGQLHDAWFYYEEARSLSSPLPFMSTLATDKLYDESQSLKPADMPGGGKTAELAAGTANYKMTAVFPEAVGSDLDLIVKYQTADASNNNVAYADNVAVMKALVAKYPEVRDAFASVVARAVDSSGRDYGTLMAMKDIK